MPESGEYASAVQRPILPVAIADLTYAMPRDLLQRQVIDYSKPTEDAAFRLVAALTSLAPAPPLPDPLPDFAENRALAQEWAYRFLAAAVQERLLGEEARRILPDGPPDITD